MTTAVKEHGLLFSGPMVRAILNTRVGSWPPEPIDPAKPYKGVTRRLDERLLRVKKGDRLWARETWGFFDRYESLATAFDGPEDPKSLPAYCANGDAPAGVALLDYWKRRLIYRADAPYPHIENPRWRPSIHLPRWASRILLEATEDARREPLQAITEDEARLEGEDAVAVDHCCACHRDFLNDRVVMLPNGADICPLCKAKNHTCVWDDEFDCCDGPPSLTEKFEMLWQSLHTKPGERWSDNPEVTRIPFKVLEVR